MAFTIGQILDLLMVVVLIMFIPIGLWRGALREWVALVGITLGTLLAAEWAGPWGGDLAVQTRMDPKMAAFLVGAAFFLGTTLLIGYGGGVALPYRPDLTLSNRLLGALLGVGNGMLILSGMLRLMQRHLFDQRSDSLLLGTTLSRFLIDYVGWVQLVLLTVLLLCVTISALRRWVGGPPLMEEYAPGYHAASAVRVVQPAGTWEPYPSEEIWDEGPPEVVAPPAAAARAQGDTAVLHVLPPQPNARPGVPPAIPVAPPAPPRATTLVSVPRVVDIARPIRPTPAPTLPSSAPAEAASPGYTNGHTPVEGERAGATPANGAPPLVRNGPSFAAPGDLPTASPICPVCANSVAARSRFCHHCGHIIGEAERRRVARQD